MGGQDPVALTLQAALQRGYLTPAQIQQAQAFAQQPGAPGVLQLLHQRFLTPQQAADLGRVYQEALQGPGTAPMSDADAEQTLVTAVTPAMIARPPSPADSALTSAPPPSAGFSRSGVLGAAPPSGIADDSRTIQGAPPSPTHAAASRAGPPGSSGPTGETVGALAALGQSRDSGPRREGFLGPYKLIRELARGGMGVVYEAEREGLDRKVALKQLLAGGQATAAEVERFLVEARIAARLRHPHIVGIHDVGQEGGNPYFAMDFIEGEDLNSRLGREGPLPGREAADLTRKLAEALSYAHARAVLHRDIKPANVLLHGGEPILTDFGLAKDVQQEGQSGLTQAGAVMGTPSYMPPEQAEGQNELVDRRADVYSLGATLYAMLTGEPPFKGATVLNTITKVLSHDPVPPRKHRPEVERDLEVICLKCLEKEPDARYPTAQALAEDLARFLADQPIEARSPSVLERGRKWVRRNKAIASVLALCSFLLLGGGVGAVVWQRQSAAAAKAAELAKLGAAAEASFAKAREGAEGPDAFALALDALIVTSRWSSADPAPEAQAAQFEAALHLGRVATALRQWKVAAQSFTRAAAQRPDSETLGKARAEFEELRARASREREARLERTRETLAAVREGKLASRNQIQDALLSLLQSGDEDTIDLLLEEVDEFARRGREIELELLRRGLAHTMKDLGEEKDSAPLLAAYAAQLEAGVRPTKREQFAAHWEDLQRAKSGAQALSLAEGIRVYGVRSYESVLIQARREAFAGADEAALLAQRVLARIPTTRARQRQVIDAIRRCLACEVDAGEVLYSFRALAQIPLPEALTAIYEQLNHFEGGMLRKSIAQILESAGREADGEQLENVPALLEMAAILGRNQKFAQAVKVLERARAIDPQHAEVLLSLAKYRAMLGQKGVAAALVAEAQGLELTTYRALREIALVLILLKRGSEALDYLQQARAATRNTVERSEVIRVICGVHEDAGDYDKAGEVLRVALAESFHADLAAAYGDILCRQERLDEAMLLYEKAHRFDPNNPILYEPLGRLRLMSGRAGEAKALVEEGIERWPHRADLILLRATVQLATGDPGAAVKDCESGLRVATRPDTRALLVATKADALFYLGRPAEGVELLREVLPTHPDRAGVRALLGKLLLTSGKPDEAAKAARESLEAQANNPSALLVLSRIALARNQPAEARRHAVAALEQAPRMVDARFCVACAELVAGNIDASKRELSVVLEAQPTHIEANFWSARIAIDARDLAAAEKHLALVVAAAPGHDQAWTQRGLTAALGERWEDAERYYKKALELNAGNFEAWSQCGDCARLNNRFKEALVSYQRALELSPNHHHARLGRALCWVSLEGPSIKVRDELVWFAKNYPQDHRIGLVKELIQDVNEELAKKE